MKERIDALMNHPAFDESVEHILDFYLAVWNMRSIEEEAALDSPPQ